MCYLKKPQFRVPAIARYFEHQLHSEADHNWGSHNGSTRLLSIICDLSVTIHHELRQLSREDHPIGSAHDIQRRLQLYSILLDMRRSLPEDLKWTSRPTLQNLYLR